MIIIFFFTRGCLPTPQSPPPLLPRIDGNPGPIIDRQSRQDPSGRVISEDPETLLISLCHILLSKQSRIPSSREKEGLILVRVIV
jgi:hypothetical protein